MSPTLEVSGPTSSELAELTSKLCQDFQGVLIIIVIKATVHFKIVVFIHI